MFTGLTIAVGEVVRLVPGSGDVRLRIRPEPAFTALQKGESIAVNGACLSVESFDADTFTAYASRETLSLTNLGGLRPGGRVNLERALCLGDRLGGHLVSGHVDALATVEHIAPTGDSLRIRVRFPEIFGPQVIQKGSVTLDGVSLTVNDCGLDFLEVNVIPETQKATTIGSWRPGRTVNLETDLIGKYVQRLLRPTETSGTSGGLTLDMLRDNGF